MDYFRSILLSLITTLCSINYVNAYSIEIYTGLAVNAKEKVKINHPNGNIEFESSPKTKSFTTPPYYGIRLLKKINDDLSIGVDFIHHKTYFEENLPSMVDNFEATDGYNYLLLAGRYKIKSLKDTFLHVNAGVVSPNMDAIVYDRKTHNAQRYPIDGYGLKLGLQKKFFINNMHAFFVETDLLYSKIASTKLVEGSAQFGNKSIHLTFGYAFGK